MCFPPMMLASRKSPAYNVVRWPAARLLLAGIGSRDAGLYRVRLRNVDSVSRCGRTIFVSRAATCVKLCRPAPFLPSLSHSRGPARYVPPLRWTTSTASLKSSGQMARETKRRLSVLDLLWITRGHTASTGNTARLGGRFGATTGRKSHRIRAWPQRGCHWQVARRDGKVLKGARFASLFLERDKPSYHFAADIC